MCKWGGAGPKSGIVKLGLVVVAINAYRLSILPWKKWGILVDLVVEVHVSEEAHVDAQDGEKELASVLALTPK